MSFPVFYTFNVNRRVYAKDNRGGPIYAEHYQRIVIIGENEKEFICEHGGKINKRSMKYQPYEWSKERLGVISQKQRDGDIWIQEHRSKIARLIDYCRDADKLKEVARIMDYTGEAK